MTAQSITASTVVRPTYVAAGLAVLAVLILFAPTFGSMIAIWNRDATFTHGYIIPLLSLWLLWRDRHGLAAEPIAPDLRALVPAAVLLLIWLAADLVAVQVVRQAAATALIPIVLWTVLGSRWVLRALFPLLYLLFAVPFGDFLVPVLVSFTTEFTVAAVKLVGIPIYRDGTFFALPSGNFEVIKACSGVRYLIATVALGTLFAALSYRTWRKRLAFMALCIVLPIIANGMRAFGIVMIAHYSNMKYAAGVDHLIYGWVFFGFVMLLLFWIGGKFADDEEPAPNAPTVNSDTPPRWSALGYVVALLAFTSAVSWMAKSHAREQADDIASPALRAGGEWSGPTAITEGWQPIFVSSGASTAAKYVRGAQELRAFARHYAWQEEGADEATAAPLVAESQIGWRTEPHANRTSDERSVQVIEVFGPRGERWRVWQWFLIDGRQARSRLHAKVLELGAWFVGRVPRASTMSVAVPLHDIEGGTTAADQVLAQFVDAMQWRLVEK